MKTKPTKLRSGVPSPADLKLAEEQKQLGIANQKNLFKSAIRGYNYKANQIRNDRITEKDETMLDSKRPKERIMDDLEHIELQIKQIKQTLLNWDVTEEELDNLKKEALSYRTKEVSDL